MQVLLHHLKAMILTPKQDMCFWIEICAGTDCTRLKDNVASKKKSPRGTDAKVVSWCVLMSSPFPGSNSSH